MLMSAVLFVLVWLTRIWLVDVIDRLVARRHS